MRSQKILICGAGIAGPCLAYWLLRYGFEPTLIERAPGLRTGGYVIDFWGLGFDIAEKMGLMPALRRDSYQINEVRIVDALGRRTGGFTTRGVEKVLGSRFLSILRSDLSRAIFESLGGKVRTLFGDSITELHQDAMGVDVSFAAGPAERFDLVIGAGGLHSPVRRLAFGPLEWFERYLGYHVASFSAAGYPRHDPHAYVTYSAPGLQLSRYSLRGDRTAFLFAFASEKILRASAHDLRAQKEILRERFLGAGWECDEVLNALEESDELYFDSVSQVCMETWKMERIALVGDACFCPSFLAGQGSALAMIAGYILAGELAKAGGDHRAAFANYESMLQPLMVRKQRAAESFARSFVPRSDRAILVRNYVTKLMMYPFVMRWFLGHLLNDPLALPTYR